MKGRRVLHSSVRMNYGTPGEFYGWVDSAFGFTIDAAAEKWSAKCRRYWTKEQNALAQDWSGEIAWDNPPYGDSIGAFLDQARLGATQGGTSVHLVPSRVDTDWFRKATEQGMGRFRGGRWDPFSRVEWRCFAEATVGIYHHDQRLIFELTKEDRAALIAEGKNPDDAAPFPSSLIIFDPPTWRKRLGKRLPTRAENDAAIEKYGRPLLTFARPK